MRTVIVLVIVAGLGWVFLTQKRHEQEAAASTKTTAQQSPSPRPVSEHNWAKHALDKTKRVTDQVAKTRKEDGTR
jgi:hypothetical protein